MKEIIITKEMIQEAYKNAVTNEYSNNYDSYANTVSMIIEVEDQTIEIILYSDFTSYNKVKDEIRTLVSNDEFCNPTTIYENASYSDDLYIIESPEDIKIVVSVNAHDLLVELTNDFTEMTREYQIEDIERKIEQATSDYNEYHSIDNATN